MAEVVTQAIFGGGSSKQEIVDLFNSSQTMSTAGRYYYSGGSRSRRSPRNLFFDFSSTACSVAISELRSGLSVNALLFAAAHTHLPSALPLFVSAVCFTLAYEWSGSILVSMAMHALFNSAQLILLAFPELLQQ